MRREKNTQKDRNIIGLSIPVLLALFAVCALTSCGDADGAGDAGRGFARLWSRPGAASDGGGDILILVNPWNPIPDGYEPTLAALSDGTQVDERCIEALRRMLRDCREAGYEPYICSAYRSMATQAELYENKVARLMDEGLDEAAARERAAMEVAVPGTSEHQLGLAVDIIDAGYTELDEAQAGTGTQQWLMRNSWRYGFILRYEESKSELTGIIFEPWHYRYVGRSAAAEIYEKGLCLEEYLEEINGNG